MSDPEVIRTPFDKNTKACPREQSRRSVIHPKARAEIVENARNGSAPARPAMWHAPEAFVDGAFPKLFLPWALRLLRAQPCEVLHVCSGSLGPDVGGIRVDVRESMRPDVVADGRALPFADGSVRAVLIDPPYSVEYSESLYGTEYPRPSHLLAEASRVVRPCGRIGILHYLVPKPPPGAKFLRCHGLMTGLGYRIRAFTVYEREQARLV